MRVFLQSLSANNSLEPMVIAPDGFMFPSSMATLLLIDPQLSRGSNKRYSATRSRIVECIQLVNWNT